MSIICKSLIRNVYAPLFKTPRLIIAMSKRKTPSNSSNPNHDFCEFLIAAGTLAAHSIRITSGKDAQSLPGVGAKIAKKIDEFLATGKLQKLECIHSDATNVAITLLTRISGIGPAKAKQLVDLGITKIGLKYFEDFEERIPRKEIDETDIILQNIIPAFDPLYKVTICGSYRRGNADSGDIDVLITHPSYTSDKNDKRLKTQLLKNVVEALEACKLITETISLGETKFMGACKLSEDLPTRRLDIRLTPHDQFYCSILYFTGSDQFNKNMRVHALETGFTLNEYTLRPVGTTGVPGEPLEITSEEDIFDFIGYPYKTPEERNV